jgi:RimJ/RimL family protein N-acetyltransferase
MGLTWSFASRNNDEEDFAAFSCWDGSPDDPWAQEVEDYIQWWVLRRARYAIALRNEHDELVAVAAFDERVIAVPLVAPVDHSGWHLLVMAIRLEDQRRGLSSEVFSAVFEAMRAIDPDRVLYTAYAHRDNRASLRAGERVGLLRLRPKDEHYWILLGEVPDGANRPDR